MDEQNESSLHERVEQLENTVKELQRMLTQMNEAITQKDMNAPAEHLEAVFTPETTVTPQAVQPAVTISRAEKPLNKILTQPSRTREEWEALIGGKLLNRIGALALIIGIGFFLKYSFDNNWISETVRVLIGGGIGLFLLYGGWHFHKQRLQVFAQGLVGAGISILYLSVYASFNFYHLVPQTAAFVLMSMVTILTFFQALKYDSLAVAFLGWFGGFLTPFLLSTGVVNEIGLFTYIALLDTGLLAILYRKNSWAILEPFALGATYLTFIIWCDEYYQTADLPVAAAFLTIFWGLFYLFDLTRIKKSVITLPKTRQWVVAVNAFLYFLLLFVDIFHDYKDWRGAITLLIGAVYSFTFMWVKRHQSEDANTLRLYALNAIALLVIATAIQFSGFILVVCWSLEALLLVWCGINWKLRSVWKAALCLFVLTGIRLFLSQFPDGIMDYSPFENFRFILNQRALAFAVLSAALGVSVLPFKHMDDEIIKRIRGILHYCWGAVLFTLCTVETYDYFADRVVSMQLLMMTLAWMVYSLPIAWSGLRARVEPVLYCGYSAAFLAVVVPTTLGFITFDPITNFRIALNIRAAVLVLLIVGTFFHTHWLKNIWKAYKWNPGIRGILQIALVLLVFSLITGETKDFFEKSIVLLRQGTGSDVSGDINRLENLRQLSLSGVWLIYSIFLMGLGMWRRVQGLRIMSIVLFGISILKIFIYDLSFLETLYRIFSFMGLGLILLAVSYLYQRYKTAIFKGLSDKEQTL